MPFERRILLHGADPNGTPQLLSLSAVKSCWFDLHRQGGCGRGQLVLSDDFDQRDNVQVGDWISFEPDNGDRWYLGQVQERRAKVPAGLQLRLEGMSVELNQIFPGGFGSEADGTRPWVFGVADMFSEDPDHAIHSMNVAASADDLVRILIGSSLPSSCPITYDEELVETPAQPAPVVSLKVRGEESVRALMKDLALRAQGASWGVDEQGAFFFLKPRENVIATFEDRKNLTSLAETQDLEFVFNRILLTGDYVYDRRDQSDVIAQRSYRWRSTFLEPRSRRQFGDRRIRLWLPWIRTREDGVAFAREFFRIYSQPKQRYLIETLASEELPRPWLGKIQINDHLGEPLIVARPETIRVLFDHVPRFRMELGPIDPRDLWPEPPHDERWELPNNRQSNGGDVTLPTDGAGNGGGGDGGGNGGSNGSDTQPHLSASETSESDPVESEDSSDSLDSSSAPESSGVWMSEETGHPYWPASESGSSSQVSSLASEDSDADGSSPNLSDPGSAPESSEDPPPSSSASNSSSESSSSEEDATTYPIDN